ncbi:22477_t:CDS:2 [Cetraspora pellucida]|uniref:22477_t:CDS:1 n=1 Tax=Cetraspora pellucida TaxID=1433469 RepID=A0A9N8WD26_9GLOM|nr:22477_t:CDS:2 [Cetraspora pellucida]
MTIQSESENPIHCTMKSQKDLTIKLYFETAIQDYPRNIEDAKQKETLTMTT